MPRPLQVPGSSWLGLVGTRTAGGSCRRRGHDRLSSGLPPLQGPWGQGQVSLDLLARALLALLTQRDGFAVLLVRADARPGAAALLCICKRNHHRHEPPYVATSRGYLPANCPGSLPRRSAAGGETEALSGQWLPPHRKATTKLALPQPLGKSHQPSFPAASLLATGTRTAPRWHAGYRRCSPQEGIPWHLTRPEAG